MVLIGMLLYSTDRRWMMMKVPYVRGESLSWRRFVLFIVEKYSHGLGVGIDNILL